MIPLAKFHLLAVPLILCLSGASHSASATVQYQPHVVSYDSARISSYSTAELIDLLSEGSFKQNVHGTHGIYNTLPPDRRQLESPSGPDPRFFVRLNLDTHALDFTIAVERQLVARRPLEDLLTVFVRTVDMAQQAWVLDVLSQIRGSQTDSALRHLATSAKDRTTYLSLKYFALGCDSAALAILNHNYMQYPVPSIEWASVVRSFGECKYTPAASNLVKSLTALMLDLGYAAHRSLLSMYPDAGIDYQDPVRAQKEWDRYVSRHR